MAGFSPIINDLGPGMAERKWESEAIALSADGAEIQGSWDVVVNCICEPAIHSQALERVDLEIAKLGAPVVTPPRRRSPVGPRQSTPGASWAERCLHAKNNVPYPDRSQDLG